MPNRPITIPAPHVIRDVVRSIETARSVTLAPRKS